MAILRVPLRCNNNEGVTMAFPNEHGPTTAADIVRLMALTPHPEGGWYRETVRRRAARPGERDAMTAILFLLDRGERSHWHRVDADELWLWHAGAPLTLRIADGRETAVHRLGADLTAGHSPQQLVPASAWQSAEAADGWALASCVVVPGFDFAGFDLAPAGWRPPG